MSQYNPVAMKQVDYLKTIFQLFLGYLTEAAVDELIERCLREEGGGSAAKEFTRLLEAPTATLLELVHKDGDEEDKVKYLNVFLWRQAIGRRAEDERVRYTFDEAYYNWLIHRLMIANGYDWKTLTGTVLPQGDATESYLAQVETQLRVSESWSELQDASHLAMLLNVIGPKIRSYAGLPRVIRFIQRVIEGGEDEAVRWLNPSAYTLLVHDLSYSLEESWPVYQRLISLEANRSIFNYPAWVLGVRLFGQRAKDELQGIAVPGGYELLEAMATK
jgi:hypothetical protein